MTMLTPILSCHEKRVRVIQLVVMFMFGIVLLFCATIELIVFFREPIVVDNSNISDCYERNSYVSFNAEVLYWVSVPSEDSYTKYYIARMSDADNPLGSLICVSVSLEREEYFDSYVAEAGEKIVLEGCIEKNSYRLSVINKLQAMDYGGEELNMEISEYKLDDGITNPRIVLVVSLFILSSLILIPGLFFAIIEHRRV